MREVKPQPKSFSERVAEAIDSFVGFIAPEKAIKRRQIREAGKILSRFSAYRGASKSRLRTDWVGSAGSPDADLLAELPTLRERSRDLNRNDGVAASITNTIVANEIGRGINPQSRIDAKVLGISDEQAGELQEQAEANFKEWCSYADAGERLHFTDIQQLVDRQILENGEVFLLRQIIEEPYRPFAFAWQIIEADRVDTPHGMQGDTSIRKGVKVGVRGEPVGYYIRRTHPGDGTLGVPKDLTAFDYHQAKDEEGRPNVLHLYHVLRPGQTRGEPFFAPVLDKFKDLADYLEAEVVAARVAACFSLWIKKADPYGAAVGNASSTNSANQRLESLEPGMIEYLGERDEVISSNPSRPGTNFDPFIERMLRLIGAALGLPYELVAKDFSKTSYISARMALLDARRYFRMRQEWLSRKLCQPSWDLAQEEGYLRGYVDFPDFYSNRRALLKCRWIPDGWQWAESKEVAASIESVAGGIATSDGVIAAQGDDGEELRKQRAQEVRSCIRISDSIFDETGVRVPWQMFDPLGSRNATASPANTPEQSDQEQPKKEAA